MKTQRKAVNTHIKNAAMTHHTAVFTRRNGSNDTANGSGPTGAPTHDKWDAPKGEKRHCFRKRKVRKALFQNKKGEKGTVSEPEK